MNIQDSPLIRRAVSSDAENLANLINLAGEGIPNWLWTRACVEGQTPLDVGIERARRTSGGFSYKNALIAERNGRPEGMILSYAIEEAPSDKLDDLPAPIVPFVALEKLSVGTWFINALAVYGEAQGQGIGARLLLAAEDLARRGGLNEMSIQVYSQNTGAVRLYERHGYRFAASEPVRKHPCPPYYTGDVLQLKKSMAT